jgi:hypothetical protein
MDSDIENDSWPQSRKISISNSFDFGDDLPEIQLKFRESIDYGHSIDRISRYILKIDNMSIRDY